MLASTSLLILATSLLAPLSPTFAYPVEHDPEILQPKSFITQETNNAYPPLRFLTHFGSRIPPDSNVQLEWGGGSGEGVEVYYIPQWPGQEDYAPIDIVPPTKDTRYVWHTPSKSEYPEGTTFIIGINDVLPSIGAVWYDITGLLSFSK
ncbi:hypothetical protein IAR50_002729 [Cryptococcus sp. DSM 104548]